MACYLCLKVRLVNGISVACHGRVWPVGSNTQPPACYIQNALVETAVESGANSESLGTLHGPPIVYLPRLMICLRVRQYAGWFYFVLLLDRLSTYARCLQADW